MNAATERKHTAFGSTDSQLVSSTLIRTSHVLTVPVMPFDKLLSTGILILKLPRRPTLKSIASRILQFTVSLILYQACFILLAHYEQCKPYPGRGCVHEWESQVGPGRATIMFVRVNNETEKGDARTRREFFGEQVRRALKSD